MYADITTIYSVSKQGNVCVEYACYVDALVCFNVNRVIGLCHDIYYIEIEKIGQ